MPVGKRALDIWRGGDPPPPKKTLIADAPEPWGVLYAQPNPDGSRKNCKNCFSYVLTRSCKVHAPELVIPPDGICGYHIFGTPHRERGKEYPGLQYLDPTMSGLEQVPGGTSCDRCRYYEEMSPQDGLCMAVQTNGAPAVVQALGCCARWVRA